MKKSALILCLCAAALYASGPLGPPGTQGIGIDQKLNAQLPLSTPFVDESGTTVPLRSFFSGKPVLLVPMYFQCPMLCSQVLSGVVAALRPLSLKPGRDFDIVAFSFDPNDTPAVAKEKRDHYASSYSSRAGTGGWHFLTGTPASIAALTKAIGFRYRWDAPDKMFIHASGIMFATPEGRLARYLYGVDYEPKDVKLALVESSHNRIGSPADQILLFCYHYDPKTGKYGATVINLLRGAAILTLVLLAGGMAFFWKRDIRTYREEHEHTKV